MVAKGRFHCYNSNSLLVIDLASTLGPVFTLSVLHQLKQQEYMFEFFVFLEKALTGTIFTCSPTLLSHPGQN